MLRYVAISGDKETSGSRTLRGTEEHIQSGLAPGPQTAPLSTKPRRWDCRKHPKSPDTAPAQSGTFGGLGAEA